ncbi:Metallo-dependent phosphatase [Wolfiporia cocos MD-104 SS10]|uniref:Metallo-dependent phosphatase n=1 Tax=Wolfiporia cocos (strain MD-104) TaxID=742152 RepID=A0A2H3JBU5_WOLCO|nr:Metallo-dependent phosphatase [Wolfiporia cocos MD-104 SS10]
MEALLDRQPPTAWESFLTSPKSFVARYLYGISCQEALQGIHELENAVEVVCISDTHSAHHALPGLHSGDVLIHAGDLTNSGTVEELHDALTWLESHPHPHKIFVAGNHNRGLADPDIRSFVLSAHPSLTYLENNCTTLNVRGRRLVVYGSPQTPRHGSFSFQYPRATPSEAEASQVWSNIPETTDILAIWRIRPKLHVFGHIHGARGVEHLQWTEAQRLCERICSGLGGWLDLLRLLICICRVVTKDPSLVDAGRRSGCKAFFRGG